MKQYIELLKTIQEKGTYKPAARANMPGTQSLFGYQFRHNLADGFPLLTTKKISFKNVVTELLWFLRGDTNIKYLVDNECNIWNEDAYNFYLKGCKLYEWSQPMDFKTFIEQIKTNDLSTYNHKGDKLSYKLGDCGYQYGRVWRSWDTWTVFQGSIKLNNPNCGARIYEDSAHKKRIDQIQNLVDGLIKSPESRRHIVTAIDPAHDQDLALYWCHAMFQFNCRPLTYDERVDYAIRNHKSFEREKGRAHKEVSIAKPMLDDRNIPKYYLDCQLYQRSADSVLGVPYNIASYALLTHILAKICNMIPGEFIHTFGDIHIYDNHKEAVAEQLTREPKELPTLKLSEQVNWDYTINNPVHSIDELLKYLSISDFTLENYNPAPTIKAELSTGLLK